MSGIGILCSQNLWAFIGIVDWNRLPIAELERHYHGRENQNTERKCIDVLHAINDVYTCLIKCLVQTAMAPPPRSGYYKWVVMLMISLVL